MRSATIAILAVLLVPAAAGAPTRTVTAPASVTALAFDAGRVAYASGRSASDCNRVQVWDLATRGVTTFPRPTTCVQTSTGSGISDLSIAGNRVLWAHYIGGNQREWTLWTATTTKTKPLRLRFITRDADDAPPIVVGDGESALPGGILPYAVDSEVIALRTNGARRFAWTAPARVTALSALGGELAVASAGGVVTVLDAGGNVLRTESYAVGDPGGRARERRARCAARADARAPCGRVGREPGSCPHDRGSRMPTRPSPTTSSPVRSASCG